MQKAAVALLACLAIVLVAGFFLEVHAQNGWAKFSPDGGNFSILMPGNPKVEVENKIGPFGPYTSNLLSEAKGGTTYLIGWTDYPTNVSLNVQGEINATRDNFLKSVNGKLIAEKEISLDGHPGLEFTAEMNSKFYVISRIYVVGNRPYQILAVTQKYSDQTNANRFLWSFRFEVKR
jgi:hypothetical protein